MKRFSVIFTLLLVAFAAFPAAKVTVVPPPRAFEGDKFAVTVRVADGRVEGAPATPQIPGCTYIYGPAVSQSHSTSIINGRVESSSSIEYTFTYRAEKSGSATIPAITVKVEGKNVTTRPVQFTISERGSTAPTRNRPVSVDDITTQSSDRPVGANDVFVRIILNRPSAYEQEAIECTIKLYTKYGIEEFFPTKQPSFDGFLIQEMDLRPTLNQREEYNGQVYMTAVLKKCIIFPQKSGRLTINSGEYDISVVQFDQVGMGYFSVSTPTKRKIKVSSNSASIMINPLPSPAPDGFSGAVGKFTVDSRLIGNNFHTGEAASLIYTVKGTGNIKYVKEPDLDFPSEFELYTPKSNFEGGVEGANVTGTMTIDYTFIPQSVGEFRIGSDHFVYFDPEKREYVTITTPTYNIRVEKGAEDERTEIKTKNTDILHIKRDVKPADETSLTLYAWYYWLLYLAAAGVLAALIVGYRRNLRLNADVEGRRLARADKVAAKRLKKARTLMEAGDRDHFYAAILEAVWGYLSDKLSIPASQLSRDNISSRLIAVGAPEELASKFVDVLDQAETARYTPDASGDLMNRLYTSASEALHAMEKLRVHPPKHA